MSDHHSTSPSTQEDEKRTVSVPSQISVAAALVHKPEDSHLETPDPAFEVTLGPEDDPKQWPLAKKWLVTTIVCSGALCATCAASMASFAEDGVSRAFHVSREVSVLGVTLFVLGLGYGPLLVGPLSEVHGRNPVYYVSYLSFFALSWIVTFAPNISVYLVFRYVTGFCGSAFLSVAGGSVSDVFNDASVAMPMAIYTVHPLLGPALGPLISGYINQNSNWRWTFRVLLIWTFAVLVSILLFMPETYAPALLKKKARRMRKATGDDRYWAPIERQQKNLFRAMVLSCYVPFKLIAFDGMALLINIWAALILGIQFLTFQAFPIIFEGGHGFTLQQTGMSFIGMEVGLLLGLALQPIFIRWQRHQVAKYQGPPPPELRLISGQAGAILMPISLYWLAFATYPHVHWVVPILASVPFGVGMTWCFVSIFTYLVTAYRPIAASAMASNTFIRATAAGAFSLFARQMYDRLGTVGATALLAGLTTLAAPLPFIFYKLGARLRERSSFAV